MRLKDLRLNENNILRQVECEIIKCTNKKIDQRLKDLYNNDYTIEYDRENVYKCLVIDGDYIFFSLKNISVNKELMSFKRGNYRTLCDINILDFNNKILIINIYAFNPSSIANSINLILPNEKFPKEREDNRKVQMIKASENIFFPYFYVDSKIYIFSKDECIIGIAKNERDFLFEEKIKSKEYKLNNKLSLSNGVINLLKKTEYERIRVAEELKDYKGYLDIWDRYSKKEGEAILKRARKIGIIDKSKNVTYGSSNTKIILKNNVEDLEVNDMLAFSNEKPIYLEDLSMDWEEYLKYRKEERENRVKQKEVVDKSIKEIKGKEIDIEGGDISQYKYCFLSIKGSEQVSKRRLEARNDIKTGLAANPNIGLIIEGKSKIGTTDEVLDEIEPLSPFVLKKVFKNEPTPIQKEAIEIALNTPDIAVIQGPPGTGKTTVITAIIERLNELTNKSKNNKGAILITSFQHDAVINVIERLRVNSLPTMKFGRKEDEDYRSEEIIYKWCDDLENKIRDKNPQVKETPDIILLNKLYAEYSAFASLPTEKELLGIMKKMVIYLDSSELETRIDELIEKANLEEVSYNTELVSLIRSLRTNKNSFLDDGNKNAKKLYYQLLENLNLNIKDNIEIINYLKEAKNKEEITDEFIERSKKFKYKLLNKFIPKPFDKIIEPKSEIKEIYEELKKEQKKPLDEIESIMFDLLTELEYNRESIKKSIEEYGYVYASTTQQSMGSEIKAKKSTNKPTYEVVIVDEAARVNPLDLMIPISQAEKKIILVGDHRQLPHIYDDEIFEEMQKDEESGNSREKEEKEIKESMFKHLKEKAEILQKNDGIKRTITLDRQYRMHPLLGNFINENFYKKYNEGFRSPLSADYFKQNFFDKPLVWIDVKHSMGNKYKVGTSWVRDIEAKIIAKELKKMYDSKSGKNLTYGVITFYSSQVTKIKLELRKIDFELEKKVRVGSVDAFQGMEFDVMFLSVVRTENNNTEINSKKDYYGFLTFENRLCVALSRQKKLLVVVGNSDIFVSPRFEKLAEEKIPAMKNLYNLCKAGEGIIIDGESI